MNYWITEGSKKVHPLGACAEVDDAYDAAVIWFHHRKQSNPAIRSMGVNTAEVVFGIIDEEGTEYGLEWQLEPRGAWW
jgi:hypothetical protein